MSGARERVTDARGDAVRVGDRIAAAVNSWNGPNLVIGVVERLTEKRTVIAVETHTSHFHERTSAIDDSLRRFVKLEAAE
ncbi:hypothetical protein SEA_BARNSTORMER_29 [Microbacterium phage Barnstormer]|uniref:Uncharacterized protein n=1 Tax=Microbacterium phage Barnstormer TaxID=3028491 RepID=A0AAF0CL91_9CAUD|nr:hypothetical protein SEA_BARNSTORMER_29 [Microbacterium phage Barnstormer]WDS52135.1 hypothetical protein SEA_UTZCHIPS_29 [Microbacterium phage UtzChips]